MNALTAEQRKLLDFIREKTGGRRLDASVALAIDDAARRASAVMSVGVTLDQVSQWSYMPIPGREAGGFVQDPLHPQTLQDLIRAGLVEMPEGWTGRTPRYQLTEKGIRHSEPKVAPVPVQAPAKAPAAVEEQPTPVVEEEAEETPKAQKRGPGRPRKPQPAPSEG